MNQASTGEETQKNLSETLAHTAREMNRKGLNQGRSGNVSARFGDGLLITASGSHFDEITPEHIVATDFSGRYQGALKPSSELSFHAAIYQQRPDARAVVHVHSPWATTLACMHRSIPPFHYMVAVAGGRDIPCVPYATFGTTELGEHITRALEHRDACLMANHGMVALGGSVAAALELALEVEVLARCYGQILSMGEPVLLDEKQMDEVIQRFHGYRAQARLSDEH